MSPEGVKLSQVNCEAGDGDPGEGRPIAMMSLLAWWCSGGGGSGTGRTGTGGRKVLHVGAERRVNCEHVQALSINVLRRQSSGMRTGGIQGLPNTRQRS